MIGIGLSQMFKELYYFEENQGMLDDDKDSSIITMYFSLIGRKFNISQKAIIILPIAGEILSINKEPNNNDRFSIITSLRNFQSTDMEIPNLKHYIENYSVDDSFHFKKFELYSELFKWINLHFINEINENPEFKKNMVSILSFIAAKYISIKQLPRGTINYLVIVLNNDEVKRIKTLVVNIKTSKNFLIDVPMISNNTNNIYGMTSFTNKVVKSNYLFFRNNHGQIMIENYHGTQNNSDLTINYITSIIHKSKYPLTAYFGNK